MNKYVKKAVTITYYTFMTIALAMTVAYATIGAALFYILDTSTVTDLSVADWGGLKNVASDFTVWTSLIPYFSAMLVISWLFRVSGVDQALLYGLKTKILLKGRKQ